MRKFILALAAIAALTTGALMTDALTTAATAKTLLVPPKTPAISVTVPDTWKMEEIDYGFSAFSPGKDVYFSVEYARGKNIDAMMKSNDDWMKENSIKDVKPTKEEGQINGIKMTHFEFDTTDENGKTLVDFILLPAGDQVALITLWGSVAERNKHQADIVSIMNSIKPAK